MTTTNNANTPMGEDATHKTIISLAKEFSRILRRDVSEKDMDVIIEVNRSSNDGGCASGDFLDSNMTMDEAFINVIGRRFTFFNDEKPETEKQNAEDTELMNAAWDMAKANDFYLHMELTYPRQKEKIDVFGSSSNEFDKPMTELGEAVQYAEEVSMKNRHDIFSVVKDDKPFGFAKDGSWADTIAELAEPSEPEDVVE